MAVIRILTWNVHRCLGVDGRISPGRIAEVIAEAAPDIVALQEVDVLRKRTGLVDQAEEIARALGMNSHFHPALRVLEELYGDAILTTLPSVLKKTGSLPGRPGLRTLEPRGALWAEIDAGGIALQVVNTHLSLVARERRTQTDALFGAEWMGRADCANPVALVGDFNLVPRSRVYRRLSARMNDAQRAPGLGRPKPTFPAGFPVLRIDHVFTRGHVTVRGVTVIRNEVTRVASDHLPLVVELELHPTAPDPAEPS
ncbi:MAG: Endonuclease/exonuclease/phosphatase [Hyphomicrobiales bacterium]|nr:Endonuclease/exonuclease/phosphatase [Hyphomicrobiales bacterium]